VWDLDGVRYLDFFGGVLTTMIGHDHPAVTAAVQAQAAKVMHTSTLYPNPALSDLAETLAQILPGDLNRSFLTNSGTEADETAVLLARVHTGNQDMIVLRYGYSGRSMMAIAAGGQRTWKQIGQPMPGFLHAWRPTATDARSR
jgi:4-aminobutyrate aminotransferase